MRYTLEELHKYIMLLPFVLAYCAINYNFRYRLVDLLISMFIHLFRMQRKDMDSKPLCIPLTKQYLVAYVLCQLSYSVYIIMSVTISYCALAREPKCTKTCLSCFKILKTFAILQAPYWISIKLLFRLTNCQ